MWDKGNLHDRVKRLRIELNVVQRELEKDPSNVVIREEESVYLKAFNEAVMDEESLLKQRSKVQWLKEGDSNTGYFHRVIKGRQNRKNIQKVLDSDNRSFEGNGVHQAFVDHYSKFLGEAVH